MSCKKCDLPKTVTLRKKDHYCDNCFTNNITHKFRACIGKNKVLSPNEHVLICLSGGVGSTVLVDLLKFGISLDSTKKLRIIPFFLHLLDDNGKFTAESVLDQCKKYNFDVYVVHVSNYLSHNNHLPDVNCIPHADTKVETEFYNIIKSMPPTAANDFLLKVKRNLFIKYAKLLQCKFIFTAETTSTLAINLLCNIATGRGSQVQNDIGFADTRDEIVKILRPMKDISQEELTYYVELKQLQPVCVNPKLDPSLQSVISLFVTDLQENFQSTISTVCKTADKIGHDELRTRAKCYLCESDLTDKSLKLSALEATNISRIVSSRSTRSKSNILDGEIHVSLPVHQSLCYSCSRNHSEMNPPSMTQYL